MEQFKCGHCGNDKYQIFNSDDEDKILTKCTKCEVLSSISVDTSLRINWEDEKERGVMCTGWSK